MSGQHSLLRTEAEERAQLISVRAYAVTLDLTTGDENFDSTTTVRIDCSRDGITFLDVTAHVLRSVRLDGVDVPVDDYRAGDRRLPITVSAGRHELVVESVMTYSHDGEGLHRHVDPADGEVYLYAMSFLDAAPRWFACFDQPDLKAPVTLDVRCPDGWTVAGNGPASRTNDGTWHIEPTGPLATYFTTVLAGPYHEVRSEHDGIPLVLHTRASVAEHLDAHAADLFAHTALSLDRLHALFGVRYPWGEYHQAFVPEFNAGAMENPGCVTISEALLHRGQMTAAQRADREMVISHEMAHMWFGDLVTMRWWDDLWLNESFAEYLGHRVAGEGTWTAFAAVRKSWGYAADRRPSTHPVAGNDAADAASALNAFDGISYAKGASVLRQLATHLGDEAFLAGLRRYITEHANGNATFDDLAGAWAAVADTDPRAWLDVWLHTDGLDELAVVDGAVRRTSRLARPHAVTVRAYAPDGTELVNRPLAIEADSTPCPVPSSAVLALPDALDDSWAKTALTPSMWASAPEVLPRIAESRSRVSVWNALVLACADAELDPSAALDVVVAALPGEMDSIVVPVGRWAVGTLLGSFVSDGARDTATARYHRAFLDAARAAAPGSEDQLTAARQALVTAPDAGQLRGWLDGDVLAEGLEIDRELRWSAVLRLARIGAAGTDEIDAEARTDASTHGAAHAARCRAAVATVEAKAQAWAAITGDAARSNTELYALAEGFWVPSQRALTDEYAQRYLDEIAATATLRSGAVVGNLARRAFPWTCARRDILDGARALLADPGLDTAVRRSVVDAADDLRRAVEVRERFG